MQVQYWQNCVASPSLQQNFVWIFCLSLARRIDRSTIQYGITQRFVRFSMFHDDDDDDDGSTAGKCQYNVVDLRLQRRLPFKKFVLLRLRCLLFDRYWPPSFSFIRTTTTTAKATFVVDYVSLLCVERGAGGVKGRVSTLSSPRVIYGC